VDAGRHHALTVNVRFFLLPVLGILAGCTEEYEAVFGDPVAGAHRRWLAEDEQECEHDDGKACAKMADRYREGSDVPKDPDRAVAYLRKACDFGIVPRATTSRKRWRVAPREKRRAPRQTLSKPPGCSSNCAAAAIRSAATTAR
jgi:hypothetical protein